MLPKSEKEGFKRIMFTGIVLLLIVFLFMFTNEGQCIIKGGTPIDSYAGIQECHSKEECSSYKSRVCMTKDGDIVP